MLHVIQNVLKFANESCDDPGHVATNDIKDSHGVNAYFSCVPHIAPI